VATLTLETPEAREALARCTRLLLRWADEEAAADVDEAGRPDTSAAKTAPAATPDTEIVPESVQSASLKAVSE
jgi:hypothetical protein